MILYFGAWSAENLGHYLYSPDGRTIWRADWLPFRPTILDAGLLNPFGSQEQSKARRVLIGGWTVVTFWDRSADSRMGSNSAFIVDSEMCFLNVMALAGQAFPLQMARIPKLGLE